ncbi:MAG: RecQ family ATP-dependent DNA helicase [Myxococcales bacterium]|nr:RecQ family ATP-dependent DNA helicase [Myxococcales bacterium]
MTSTPSSELDATLFQRFGFDQFRPGQREAIEALLAGQDLLVIQPTGHGKSLLYQLPAVLLEGPTLVISPLLALMRDQITHLVDRFSIPAASLNSDQTPEENDEARARAARGEVRILFVAPEQLDNVERAAFLKGLKPSLVVIDEAHCISTWGHDFRPAYREIARMVRGLREGSDVRVLALTATADAKTEADIVQQLTPVSVQRRSMERSNIALDLQPVGSAGEKLELLDAIVGQLPPCGLIYCATRDNTEIVAEYLAMQGHEVAAYHAGLDPDRKRQLQTAFLAGDFTAIAATNALGMGIDKSDLRYVVHADVPGSITAYYQEVGRAGRDGAPARGILLYDADDKRIQEYFIHSAQPTPGDFDTLLSVTEAQPLRLNDIKRASGLHPTRVTVVVAELVEQGHLVKEADGRSQRYRRTDRDSPPDLRRYANQTDVRTRGLDAMVAYAEGQTGCLMQTLRAALGDTDAQPCGRCGPCGGERLERSPATGKAAAWLADRPVVVRGNRSGLEEGRALFDSNSRSEGFLSFMRGRASSEPLPAALLERLAATARGLGDVAAVVPLPSAGWHNRTQAAQALATALGVPMADVLYWAEPPEERQGRLRNNDQRRANVKGRMTVASGVPSGRLLLLDDYTGSGATLNEAVRALKKGARHQGKLVPLTVARIRWRLGRPGIV